MNGKAVDKLPHDDVAATVRDACKAAIPPQVEEDDDYESSEEMEDTQNTVSHE